MKIYEVVHLLEELAPKALQENYDNAGLIVGNKDETITGALLCLDSTEQVIDEAIQNNCNLVIAHHPIVFSGLKSITGKNYIERTLLKAIKNDIAIYAIHTNLDNVENGVNRMIAERIGLENLRILAPKKNLLKKLVFFCPLKAVEQVRTSIFEGGAGKIGNYDSCSFNVEGIGTFKGNSETNPFVGKKEMLHEEKEVRVETVFPSHMENHILNRLLDNHPYEEVAYDLYPLTNEWNQVGSGMIGELSTPLPAQDFLQKLKTVLNTECIRYTKIVKKNLQKVAICGGSGSFLLNKAIAQKADIFITADYKYHQFFDADDQIIIADVGHYESEQFTPLLIQRYLQEKIPNFAVHLTKLNTNPINYI